MKFFFTPVLVVCALGRATAFQTPSAAKSSSALHAIETFANPAGIVLKTSGAERAEDLALQVSPDQLRSKEVWDAKWDQMPPVTVQGGGALKTWSFPIADIERVYLAMNSQGPAEGNPLKVHIDLNQGPDNTPQRMSVYSGKGNYRKCKFWIETPGGYSSLFIRNNAPLVFPISASVGLERANSDRAESILASSEDLYEMSPDDLVQGGAIHTYPLPAAVETLKIMLKTDGRPLNAQVELIQGPNAPKYTIDIYTEDGLERPFCFVMETPGAGNVVRIINTATVEFPLVASVGPSTL